jgi:hypothetical protein
MKDVDKGLEYRLMRLVGDDLLGGFIKASRTLKIYEQHGYNVQPIRDKIPDYALKLLKEYYKVKE